MSRRLVFVAVVLVLLFAALAGQAAYLQYWRAGALDKSPLNPRITSAGQNAPRGEILASNGQVLAESVPSGDPSYPYRRVYPLGRLTAGVVGFSSEYYGDWALEAEYGKYLAAHSQPPRSWAQVIAPEDAADTVVTTLEPALQKVARLALGNRDGAVVALDPRNGDVLAMYSNPTYNDNSITSTNYDAEVTAWKSYNHPDAHHFPPLGLVATQQTFPPGSTFKVITTAAAVVSKPSLLTESFPVRTCTPLPDTDKTLCNDGFYPCGGTVAVMLPQSCDPGYALLGLAIGATDLTKRAVAFGYDQTDPLDLPGVVPAYFPPASDFKYNLPQLAYSAIGQENVRATALQNALVASAIADRGTIMTPHLLKEIIGPEGQIVREYVPHSWLRPLRPAQAAQIVPLMRSVVTEGTAYLVGFLPKDDVAAKTGTAQTGFSTDDTDDWMIAFAPASHPVIAVAVIVPFQTVSATGATVAGPVMKCVIEGALALDAGQAPLGTSTTCPK